MGPQDSRSARIPGHLSVGQEPRALTPVLRADPCYYGPVLASSVVWRQRTAKGIAGKNLARVTAAVKAELELYYLL